MRLLVLALLVSGSLAGCASGPVYETPLPRATYQKPRVAAYRGAASDPSAPAATARGTRYRTGPVASAAADWSRWPAGTVFRILATGEVFEVDDFTDDVVGTNVILLYKPTALTDHEPPREVTIEVVEWGSPSQSVTLLRSQRSSTAKRILAALVARYPERR